MVGLGSVVSVMGQIGASVGSVLAQQAADKILKGGERDMAKAKPSKKMGKQKKGC